MTEQSIVPAGDTQVQIQPTPENLLAIALKQGVAIENMDKLFDLQIRFEENEARKQEAEAKRAYVAAMADFKANAPEITKDKMVGYKDKKGNVVGYTHASLGNITSVLNAALGSFGLTAGWETNQEGNSITVTCIVTHKDGHHESTSLTAAPDSSGKKNAIQALGSAISYLERYTLLAITGCATSDQDDDGQGSEQKKAEPVTAGRFENWLDAMVESGKTIKEVETAYSGKASELDVLSDIERKKVDGYKKDLIEMMVENSKPQPPKTFLCSSGLDVTAVDCKACPKNADCDELKRYKEQR